MNAREHCYEVLMAVYREGAYSNLALNQLFARVAIPETDRGFITRVVYGTLQNSLLLRYWIKEATPGKTLDYPVLVLLLMSLYQLRFMDRVPAYAVVNEAVELAKQHRGASAGRFVNAVLRHLNDQPTTLTRERFQDEIAYQSLLHSYPEWLVRMYAKHYGEEVALRLIQHHDTPPPLSLRYNPLRPLELDQLPPEDFHAGNLSPAGYHYFGHHHFVQTPYYREGHFAIQDEASQMVAPLLAPLPGERVLDMCAAPGSKTAHLASLMNNEGTIDAVDIHPHRIQLLEEGMRRLGVTNVKALTGDVLQLIHQVGEGVYDRILLDAPCSGFGVIRRKPDLLLRTKQEQLDELLTLQQNMLQTAVRLLKPGGVMVYSTCTLNRKENQLQIQNLCHTTPSMHLAIERQIFPFEYDSDGFYLAKLTKETL